MTRGHPHSDDWLDDPPIDLDLLAALVEGDLSPEEADAVREQLLAADPGLAARVELMCQDRVMLRTLGDESPHVDLGESVTARLEREALLGLAAGESAGPIPMSRVRTVRPSRWSAGVRWLTTPAGAGLAMAAALAMAVGVTLRLLPNPEPAPTPGDVGPLAAGAGPMELSQGSRNADRAQNAVAGEAPPTQAGLAVAREEPDDMPEPARLFTDDPERALALLTEGRLLVRVRSADPDRAIAQLGRMADRPARPGESWRLGAEVNEAVATAMHDKFEPVAREAGPTVFASDSRDGPAGLAELGGVAPKASPLRAVFMADARADSAAMRSLRAALSPGDGQVAVFEELPAPIGLPPVFTAESVLWWGRPAGEWTERRHVPIVIERVER